MVVLTGYLFHLGGLCVLAGCHHIDVGRMAHACTCGEYLVAVVGKRNTSIVSPVVGDLFYLTLEVGLVKIQCSVPYTYKGKTLVVLVPCESLYI